MLQPTNLYPSVRDARGIHDDAYLCGAVSYISSHAGSQSLTSLRLADKAILQG